MLECPIVEAHILLSGEGVVHGEYGDLINANEERWHRATSCSNTGRSIHMAITPRSKEVQVHYFQIDQPAGELRAGRVDAVRRRGS